MPEKGGYSYFGVYAIVILLLTAFITIWEGNLRSVYFVSLFAAGMAGFCLYLFLRFFKMLGSFTSPIIAALVFGVFWYTRNLEAVKQPLFALIPLDVAPLPGQIQVDANAMSLVLLAAAVWILYDSGVLKKWFKIAA